MTVFNAKLAYFAIQPTIQLSLFLMLINVHRFSTLLDALVYMHLKHVPYIQLVAVLYPIPLKFTFFLSLRRSSD